MSPHAAAALDGIEIELEQIRRPSTSNHLIIELAGGLLVPLNNRVLTIDWVQRQGLPVVLVSRNYLGSINHTLLSVEACRSRGILLAGLIFNGVSVPATEQFIVSYTGLPCLGRIGQAGQVTRDVIRTYAEQFVNLSDLIGAR